MHIPTLSDLKRSLDISEQIEKLQTELANVLGGLSKAVAPAPAKRGPKPGRKRKMSAAGRARIIAAQKARWAKVKAADGVKTVKAETKKAGAKAKKAAKKTVDKAKEVLTGGEVSASATSRSGSAIKKKTRKGAKK